MNNALLSCLVQITEILGRPVSSTTLTSGLPMTGDNNFTPELFQRAASRADLRTKLIKYRLTSKAAHFPVPIILVLNNNEACILTEITEHYTAKIFTPPKEESEEIPLDALEQRYTGNAFSITPGFHFTTQSSYVAVEDPGKNWFWNAITRLTSTYSEVLVASFLINIFALALPLFTMNVYDRVVPNHSFDTLWVLASGIFLVFFFDILMRTLRSHFIDQAGKVVDIQVSGNILEKVIDIKMASRPQSVGAFANTVQSFDSVRDFITSTTVTILVDLPFAIIFLITIAILAGSLVLVPLSMFPIALLLGIALQRPLIELTKVSLRYSAEKQALIFEILNGIESVKTYCAEHIMQARWEQLVNLSAQIGVKLRFIVNLNMFFSIFIQQLAVALVVVFGVYKITSNQLTLGALIACSILSSRALAPIAQLAALLTRYHQTLTSLDSLNNIMKLPDEHPIGKFPLQINEFKGAIEFRDVNFQYPDRSSPALSNISFTVKAGEHVGIIGRVGSGKSTIAKLILGLLEPNSGSIYIDDINQSSLDCTEIRRQVGYIPQDVTLFFGTLHENITFGQPHVDNELFLRAIKVSGIDEFVRPQLGSYETRIQEGGKNLSGGQRKLVALARSVLLDPPLLLLDEPSHSMDQQTEAMITKNLMEYSRTRTLLIMTHRPSMLSLVDRIIILDAGKIIVDGPRDAVLQALTKGQVKVAR